MKSEKGISLVPLVLIVIVLMFLCAVSIYILIGPNGVLNEETNPIPSSSQIEKNEVD